MACFHSSVKAKNTDPDEQRYTPITPILLRGGRRIGNSTSSSANEFKASLGYMKPFLKTKQIS